MRLSRGKINQLSRLVADHLDDSPRVTLHKDPNTVRLRVVDVIREELRRDELIDRKVRSKISSQKRDIPEGGREWEVLYWQYYEEEVQKHRPPRG